MYHVHIVFIAISKEQKLKRDLKKGADLSMLYDLFVG